MPLPASYIPRHKISHLWIAQDVANGSPDAIGTAALTWAGGGTAPGFSIQEYKGRRCWVFDGSATGGATSKCIFAGDSVGSGRPQSSSFTVLMSVYLQALPSANMSLYSSLYAGLQVRVVPSGAVELLARALASAGSSSVSLQANKWETFGISYDGITTRFVVGGKPAGSANSPVSLNFQQQQFFGSDDSGSEGIEDGVRIEYLVTIDTPMSHAEMLKATDNLSNLFMPSRVATFSMSVASATEVDIPTASATFAAPVWEVDQTQVTNIEMPTARASFLAFGLDPEYTEASPPPTPAPVTTWTPVIKSGDVWTPQ